MTFKKVYFILLFTTTIIILFTDCERIKDLSLGSENSSIILSQEQASSWQLDEEYEIRMQGDTAWSRREEEPNDINQVIVCLGRGNAESKGVEFKKGTFDSIDSRAKWIWSFDSKERLITFFSLGQGERVYKVELFNNNNKIMLYRQLPAGVNENNGTKHFVFFRLMGQNCFK